MNVKKQYFLGSLRGALAVHGGKTILSKGGGEVRMFETC